MGARNRVGTELSYRPASLLSLAGRYDSPIPTRFLTPIDCSKIPALDALMCRVTWAARNPIVFDCRKAGLADKRTHHACKETFCEGQNFTPKILIREMLQNFTRLN
jgi:hypothetical protein